jgi:SSS family transporter
MVTVLSESIGYFVLIGVGLIMAVVVTLLIKAETRWLGTKKTSEWFSTAGRNVKTGLLAASVVSAWTWAATLLQSSTVAYQFGISGPFWYAAGASIQVVLFAILAIELKRKAPSTHTFPEIIHARFGRNSHKVFLFFALMTNTVVTAMLVLGGAAVVSSLTGIDIYIAAFLLPLGVIVYTFFGGLKATFLADYLNAAIVFAGVLIFVTAIYFTNPEIGGISGMFEKLTAAAALNPVEGNAAGAYLTLASTGALIFGVINIVGNFGTVFVDQAYWQRAIAAAPRSSYKGFLVGGLAWFAIPFALATALGLAAVAVDVSLTNEQIGLGLVAPTASVQVLGDVGAILILTMLFVAVTSAGSAELIAVSSLVTYDVYRTYAKPSASDRQLIRISRFLILGFGLGMGVLASMLLQLGVNLQYVYLSMGILIGSAVAPIALSLLWRKTNKMAASSGAIVGLLLGVLVWLGSANAQYGEITVFSTGQNIPLLLGNVTSILVGAAITLVGSMLRSENFNFGILKQKILVVEDRVRTIVEHDSDEKFLSNAARFTHKYAIALTLALVVVWPLPLYFSGYVFSEETYYLWVSTAVAWAFGAAALIVVLPLIESRTGILEVLKNLIIPLVLAAIIAVAVVASVPLYTSQVQRDQYVAELSARELEDKLQTQSHIVSQITGLQIEHIVDTTEILTKTEVVQSHSYSEIGSLLQATQERTSHITSSYLFFDRDATIVSTSSSGTSSISEGERVVQHPAFLGAKSTMLPYISSVLEGSKGQGVVYVSSPIINSETGEFEGTIAASISGEALARNVQSMTGLEETRMIFSSPDGRLLYSTDGLQVQEDTTAAVNLDTYNVGSEEYPIPSNEEGSTSIQANVLDMPSLLASNGGKGASFAYSPVQINDEVIMLTILLGSEDEDNTLAMAVARDRSNTLTFIYGILAVMGGFAVVVIMLNRRLSKLVNIRTEELEKANTELKHKDRLKDEFISIASHELRTPVQPILGFATLAKRGKIEQARAWRGVLQHAHRLQHLANEILDVSRIESGSLTYAMEKVRINDLVLDVMSSAKPNLSKDVLMEIKLDRNVEIVADRSRITQVLTNVLDNAIKFTRRGTITVESFVFEERGKTEIRISDTGGGIPADVVPYLFEKFVTKSVQDGNQHGAGLGLFISRAIVMAHKGEIFANNNSEGGATFTIVLPIDYSKWI